MFNILKLNAISPIINDIFDNNYSFSTDEANPDGIILRSFNMADYVIGDKLVAVARAGAGVNNIPIPKMTEKGVVVFNSPGANANAVKELVICGLLLSARKVYEGINWSNTLAGNGAEVPKMVEKGKGNFGGFEIAGKTLGVIGLGAIGVLVANACISLGMSVVGYDPMLSDVSKSMLNGNIKIVDTLNDLYKVSDYITLHVPLLDSTKSMINKNSLAIMKDGVVILNFSRGELVCVDGIKMALESGKARKYVVDFPTEDVLNIKNVLAIPHLGASSEEAEDNCAVMVSNQIKDYLENGNIKNSVNFPTINAERSGKCRLTVAYSVDTDAIQNVLKIFEGTKYCITKAEKKNVGYAIIDADICLCEKFASIDKSGILKIRCL